MTRGKMSLARDIHCCPIFLNMFFARVASVYCEEYMYIYIYLTA